uniref:Uncharacterized protein n=1 Tax=Rhizophora mucronata TaxID=61149 RepID=A0A2P2J7X9_RHIMU
MESIERPPFKLQPNSARSLRIPTRACEGEDGGVSDTSGFSSVVKDGGGVRKLATPRSCRPIVCLKTHRSSFTPPLLFVCLLGLFN